MPTTQRRIAASVPLADVSPRFAPAATRDGHDAAASIQRRAWFSVQPVLSRRLQPLIDDGWEIVPRSLGPHSLHIAVQHERRRWLLPLFVGDATRYVSSATVLLQRPVHTHARRD